MKIGIDLSPAEDSPAGIGQYTIGLLTKLLEIDKKNEYFTFSTTKRLIANSKNITVKKAPFPLSGRFWLKKIASIAKYESFDLLISPSNHSLSWLFPRTIQFIHDLAPIKYPQFFSRQAVFSYSRSLNRVSKTALKIIANSNAVQNEVSLYTKINLAEIDVIYPGLNPWITNPQMPLSKEIAEILPEKYILNVSTLEPRKNHINLIKAFARVAKEIPHSLVFVGKKGWFYEDIFKVVAEHNLQNRIIFLGYVKNENLATVYKKADCFVYPSFYEGFGIPPLEAQFFGLPVLVSDIKIFHETLKNSAIYCDANNPKSISEGLIKLAKIQKLTKNKFENQFSWESSAEKFYRIIMSLGVK